MNLRAGTTGTATGSAQPAAAHFEPLRVGKFWDEITVGDRMIDFPDHTVTITGEMIEEFARLTGDLNPMHLDAEFARHSAYRRIIAHGAFLTSLAIGQYHRCDYTYGTILALSRLQTRFLQPAYVGDSLYIEMLVVGKSESTHPKRGMVKYEAWMRRTPEHEPILHLDFDLIVLRLAGRKGLARLGVTDEVLAKRRFRSDTDPSPPPNLAYP